MCLPRKDVPREVCDHRSTSGSAHMPIGHTQLNGPWYTPTGKYYAAMRTGDPQPHAATVMRLLSFAGSESSQTWKSACCVIPVMSSSKLIRAVRDQGSGSQPPGTCCGEEDGLLSQLVQGPGPPHSTSSWLCGLEPVAEPL